MPSALDPNREATRRHRFEARLAARKAQRLRRSQATTKGNQTRQHEAFVRDRLLNEMGAF